MNPRQRSLEDLIRHLCHIISCAAASFAACQYALGVNLVSRNVAGMLAASVVAACWYAWIGERAGRHEDADAHQ